MIKTFFPQLFVKSKMSNETADWFLGELSSGIIKPFWEQGMEGRFDFVFVPDIEPELVNGGRGHFLSSGDYLRIFGHDGTILWEGQLQFVPSRINHLLFQDRHNLKSSVWSTLKQKGVSYADWVGWFWSEPRLKAQYLERSSYF